LPSPSHDDLLAEIQRGQQEERPRKHSRRARAGAGIYDADDERDCDRSDDCDSSDDCDNSDGCDSSDDE